MEWNKAESDLTVFGQSVAMKQFIFLLKCWDLSLKLLGYLLTERMGQTCTYWGFQ
jgi:hypothetical protein